MRVGSGVAVKLAQAPSRITRTSSASNWRAMIQLLSPENTLKEGTHSLTVSENCFERLNQLVPSELHSNNPYRMKYVQKLPAMFLLAGRKWQKPQA
jgi:hypothetical protein